MSDPVPSATFDPTEFGPYESIRRHYARHPQKCSFEYYVVWHMRNAFVFSTPDYFIMGSCVPSKSFDPNAPLTRFAKDQCDAWYIFAMAGSMPRVWEIMPWELPLIGWERVREGKRELQFFPTATLMRLCPQPNDTPNPSTD